MHAKLYGGVVVRKYGNAHWLRPFAYFLVDRTYHSGVEILDSLDLEVYIAIMTSLVTCLNMEEDEILMLEVIESSLRLTLIVGVPQTCSTFNLYDVETSIFAYTLNKVDCTHNSTCLDLRILLHKSLHSRTIPTTPWPNDVGEVGTLLLTFYIERSLSQHINRLKYEIVEQVSSFLWCHPTLFVKILHTLFRFYEQRTPLFVRMIMRRSTDDMLGTTLNDEQMTILNATHPLHLVRTQFLIKQSHERFGIFSLQVATIMSLDGAVFTHTDDIATQGEVETIHIITYRCSLKRSAPLIHLIEVVT